MFLLDYSQHDMSPFNPISSSVHDMTLKEYIESIPRPAAKKLCSFCRARDIFCQNRSRSFISLPFVHVLNITITSAASYVHLEIFDEIRRRIFDIIWHFDVSQFFMPLT